MTAHLTVDHHRCRGLALCQAMAPELFRLDDSGQAHPVLPTLRHPARIQQARDVAACCPMEAVLVRGTPAG